MQIKAKNPTTASMLTENDFKITTISQITTEVIITGIGKYKGDVTLKYAQQTVKTDLNRIIGIKKLGPVIMQGSSPDKVELLKGIQAKNPNTAKNLKVTDFDFKTILTPNPTDKTAIITGIGKYKGDVTLTYARETDLGKYIIKTKLGIIVMQDLIPTKVELLREIKVQNPDTAENLKVTDFDFKTTPTDQTAIITGIGNYKGDVTLKYTRAIPLPSLKDALTNKDLREIYVGQSDKPAVAKIKAEINEKNPDLDINGINILASDITATTAKVTGDDKQYTGTVEVEFTIINFEALNTNIDSAITCLAVDWIGYIYAAAADGYVYRCTNGINFVKIPTLISGGINGLLADYDGNIYASSGAGIVYLYDSNNLIGNFKVISEVIKNKSELITSMTIDQSDNVYVGTNKGNVY